MDRIFPHHPISSRTLTPGDVVAAPTEDGAWVAFVITEVDPKHTMSFFAAALRWRGDAPPAIHQVTRLRSGPEFLTHVKLFTEGTAFVVGWMKPPLRGLSSLARRLMLTGSRTLVMGWEAAIDTANEAADRAR